MTASRRPRIVLLLLVLSCCIGCDQVSKDLAVRHLQEEAPILLLAGTFRIQYAENTGAFLGLGADWPAPVRFWLLGITTAAFLIALLWMLLRRGDLPPWSFACLALLLAGGLSNAVDRLSSGYVVDFMNLGLGSLRTGIFNVADVFIMIGAIGLLFRSTRPTSPEPICEEGNA